MTLPSPVFVKQTDTVKNKLKRLLCTLAVYVPLLTIVYTSGWYIHQQMPVWVNDYFNVAVAEKMTVATKGRVQTAERAMSFPIGVSGYVLAQIDHVTASTKASTLSFAARMTTALMRAIMYVVFVLLGIWVVFKFLRSYKTKSTEDRIARNVVNMLLPMLQEINDAVQTQHRNKME